MRNTYEEIVAIIAKTLEVDKSEIEETTNLFDDLNVDSLNILEIVNEIEEKWGFKLTDHPELLDEMETVNSLVCFLESEIEKGE